MTRLKATWVVGILMPLHPDEIEFRGRCSCGCDKWLTRFRGGNYALNEKTYDKMRYLREEA